MTTKKVTVKVTGVPTVLALTCRDLAVNGNNFSFKPWEIRVKFKTLNEAENYVKFMQGSGLNVEISR